MNPIHSVIYKKKPWFSHPDSHFSYSPQATLIPVILVILY